MAELAICQGILLHGGALMQLVAVLGDIGLSIVVSAMLLLQTGGLIGIIDIAGMSDNRRYDSPFSSRSEKRSRGLLVINLIWIDRLLGKIRVIISQFSARCHIVLEINNWAVCPPPARILELDLAHGRVHDVVGVEDEATLIAQRRPMLFVLSEQTFPLC